jgi:beta-lactam-binding protein with PASTA domain
VVAAPPVPKCFLPKFASTSLAFVKQLLPLLGCRVGKVTKVASRKVAKGLVVSTTPGPATLPAGTAVNIKVSSGPPKKKKKKKKKHH